MHSVQDSHPTFSAPDSSTRTPSKMKAMKGLGMGKMLGSMKRKPTNGKPGPSGNAR